MSELCGVCRTPCEPVGVFAGEFVCQDCYRDVRDRGYDAVELA
jgi:hypothetical protein